MYKLNNYYVCIMKKDKTFDEKFNELVGGDFGITEVLPSCYRFKCKGFTIHGGEGFLKELDKEFKQRIIKKLNINSSVV